MLTRKIGSVLRGRATPFQIIAACVLGAMIGFAPGFAQAPGLIALLLLLLVVLNANLLLALLVGLAAELLSLLLMPVSFLFGRILLDGPTQPLFKFAINAPVLALFGFEHYATTGSLVMGLGFGLVTALLIMQIVTRLRRHMASLEENSEMYQVLANSFLFKALLFIFLGKGKGKKSWSDLLHKRVGNPIRPIGAAFAGLLVVLLLVVQMFFADDIVLAYLHRGLEQVNGATVDIASASLDLGDGKLRVQGLAMADPNALDTDLFRAESLEADIASADLLRKRLRFEKIVAVDATTGQKRSFPGTLVGPGADELPDPATQPRISEKTIEDYIQQAKQWKQRLEQARRWLEKISSGSEAQEPAAGGATDDQAEEETLRQRLKREVEEKGYRNVVATHLIEGSPTLVISQLLAQKVRSAQKLLEGQTLDIHAENLSTHPRLLDQPPRVRIRSSGGTLDVDMLAGRLTGAQTTLKLQLAGVATDDVAGSLRVGDTRPIDGGTLDFRLDGTLQAGGYVDLPLAVTLHDVTLSLPKVGSQKVSELALPAIGVRGLISQPHISFDKQKLPQALARAGFKKFADRIQGEFELEDRLLAELRQSRERKSKEATEGLQRDLKDTGVGIIGGLLESPRDDDSE